MLVAEERALRPNDFIGEETAPAVDHSANCPFCRGNEHHTPHELAVENDAEGNWQVRVVPNKYPAVASGGRQSPALPAPAGEFTGGLRPPLAPHGIHEVIIESPRHVLDWSDLSSDELAKVLRVYRERLELAYRDHQLPHGLIFKNVGQAAGASLEHIHSQLVAMPAASEVVERELTIAAEHHQRTGRCLMCQLFAEESREGLRLVSENEHFAVFCAYAGRQPYETWVIPKSHASHYTDLTDKESHTLSAILRDVIERLTTLLSPLAYNVVLHTAPEGGQNSESFHWHWELIPRTTSLAGFEWGTGMHINSVSPERAAIRLRTSKSGEKLPIQ